MFWWFLGPLTLLPLLAGRPVAWDLVDARAVLPSLFGHLLYGCVTAVVFVMLRRDRLPMRPRAATGFRGALAGVAVSAVLYLGLDVMAGAAPDVLATAAQFPPQASRSVSSPRSS